MDVLRRRGYKNFTKLGSGGQANVYKSSFQDKDCAIKVIKVKGKDDKEESPNESPSNTKPVTIDFKESSNLHDDLRREIQIISQLKHPNCVRVMDMFRTPSKVYIVMDYMPNGTVDDYIEAKGPIDYWHSQAWFCPVGRAVRYLHANRVAHRDLKLDNVLLDKSYNPVLTDFGVSRHKNLEDKSLSDTFCGTPSYQAPEILLETVYDIFKCDVWSLGVMLFVMITKQYPFDSRDSERVTITKMENRMYKFPVEIQQTFFQFDAVKDLIDETFQPNFYGRISINKLCEHRFFPTFYNEGDFITTSRSTESLSTVKSEQICLKNPKIPVTKSSEK